MFSKEGDPISSTSLVEHEIYTEGPPVRLPFRRQNPLVRAQEQSQVKEIVRDGVIRSSISPWASPVVMINKKDGSMRFCVDFRKVNDATIKDAHPLPRIDDTLESLHGAKFFLLWISNRVTGRYPFENRTRRKPLSVPVVDSCMSLINYLSDCVMLQPRFPG